MNGARKAGLTALILGALLGTSSCKPADLMPDWLSEFMKESVPGDSAAPAGSPSSAPSAQASPAVAASPESGPVSGPASSPGSVPSEGPSSGSAQTPGKTVRPSPPALATPVKLSPDEQKKLRKEFVKALASEMAALDHRHRTEFREFKASQDAREKEWKQRETESRKKQFPERPKGAVMRAYIKDRDARYKTFRQMLKDERTERERAQQARTQAMKEDQAARLREFDAKLGGGERPPENLWPRPGN